MSCWLHRPLDDLTNRAVEKERKKAEKQKKFDEKKAKTSNAAATAALSKTKEKKAKQSEEKEAPLPKYVEETPPGEKKSRLCTFKATCTTSDVRNST